MANRLRSYAKEGVELRAGETGEQVIAQLATLLFADAAALTVGWL